MVVLRGIRDVIFDGIGPLFSDGWQLVGSIGLVVGALGFSFIVASYQRHALPKTGHGNDSIVLSARISPDSRPDMTPFPSASAKPEPPAGQPQPGPPVANPATATASPRAKATRQPTPPPASTVLQTAPIVALQVFQVSPGQPVWADASASFDPDGDRLSFFFDFGDGYTISQGSPMAAHMLTPGPHTVVVSVIDSARIMSQASRTIVVS